MSGECSSQAPAQVDRFFAWEHLALLLTPFPIWFVARVAWILGLNNDGADRIAGVWVTPAIIFSIGTMFIVPILLTGFLIFLIGRDVWRAQWKRLTLYVVVLLMLPTAMRTVDADYLRLKLQQRKFDVIAQEAAIKNADMACFEFIFDRVSDNFYFGGANFPPYDKLIIYVRQDAEDRCELLKSLQHVRPLTGRYYLGERVNNG